MVTAKQYTVNAIRPIILHILYTLPCTHFSKVSQIFYDTTHVKISFFRLFIEPKKSKELLNKIVRSFECNNLKLEYLQHIYN